MKNAIEQLTDKSRFELAQCYREFLGSEPPKRVGGKTLARIIAWEVQAKRTGGLKKSVRAELRRVKADKTVRPSETRPRPGTRLVREWNGVKHVVDIDEEGIKYLGKTYNSLSAIAKKITGTHWSGPRFFGLKPKRRV